MRISCTANARSIESIERGGFPEVPAGSALIVTLVLLLLATVLAVFTAHLVLLAQRASVADVRARMIRQALDGALSQGVEYIRNRASTLIRPGDPPDPAIWTVCEATDISFPCGTAPPCAEGKEGCAPDSPYARRGNMYYYARSAGAGYDANGNGDASDALDLRSLPLPAAQRLSTLGNGFPLHYGIGVLMCMMRKPAASTDTAGCTTDPAKAQGTYLFTLTAVGNIAGESAATTLSMAFGIGPDAPGAENVPTVIASAAADLTGSGALVAAPNGGGDGLPVTLWSRGPAAHDGTDAVNTCYPQNWLPNGASVARHFAPNSDGTPSAVAACPAGQTCSCGVSIAHAQGPLLEGSDILADDGNAVPVIGTAPCANPASCKANYDVAPSEFPCDLFQYVFGVPAWKDATVTPDPACRARGLVDCFCETRKDKVIYKVADGSSRSVNADEAYLYAKAVRILPTQAHAAWPRAAQKAGDCAALIETTNAVSATGGIVWDQTGVCKLAGQIGWPDKPVVWVADGTADLAGGTVYGLVFVRDTSDPATSVGGTASFRTQSGGTIYGALVVQGAMARLNGSSAVVYNAIVMKNLARLPAMHSASPLPGSWTDRYAY